MDALAAAPGTHWKATHVFREALCAVGDLRASGLGPANAILAIKATRRDVPASLLERSVKWWIEAYYRTAWDRRSGRPSVAPLLLPSRMFIGPAKSGG